MRKPIIMAALVIILLLSLFYLANSMSKGNQITGAAVIPGEPSIGVSSVDRGSVTLNSSYPCFNFSVGVPGTGSGCDIVYLASIGLDALNVTVGLGIVGTGYADYNTKSPYSWIGPQPQLNESYLSVFFINTSDNKIGKMIFTDANWSNGKITFEYAYQDNGSTNFNDPSTSKFPVSAGTTNFSNVDLTSILNMTLAVASGSKIQWNGVVNALGMDFYNNVNIGDDYVSINAEALNQTINSSANITLLGVVCPTDIYYATGFYTSAASIVSNGQVCDSGTTPPCYDIQCSSGTLTFRVDHFDSYGGEGSGVVSGYVNVTGGNVWFWLWVIA